jgi:hypothetical protein
MGSNVKCYANDLPVGPGQNSWPDWLSHIVRGLAKIEPGGNLLSRFRPNTSYLQEIFRPLKDDLNPRFLSNSVAVVNNGQGPRQPYAG